MIAWQWNPLAGLPLWLQIVQVVFWIAIPFVIWKFVDWDEFKDQFEDLL